jgi:hypothetical protein
MSKRISLWNQQLSTFQKGEKTTAPGPSAQIALARKAAIEAQAKGIPTPPEPVEVEVEGEKEQESPVEAGEWEGDAPVEAPAKRHQNRLSKSKRRRSSVSLCVSDEEADLLYAHAANMNRSLSEWARTVLFKAMGRPVPARYGRKTKAVERVNRKRKERARAKKTPPVD